MAGFSPPSEHTGFSAGADGPGPLPGQWLSDERIAEARRVWSKAYGRVVSEDEAVGILMNVRRLAEALLSAQEEP